MGSYRRVSLQIDHAIGIRVLAAIAVAVPVRLMKRDLLDENRLTVYLIEGCGNTVFICSF